MIQMPVHSESESKKVGRVKVHPARAYEYLDRLMDAYTQRNMLYQHIHRVDAPQTIYRPKRLEIGSVEHARWLFFAAMTDRREVSSHVYAGHKKMWEGHADALYNKPLESHIDHKAIVKLLKEHNLGMPTTGATSWLVCSETLFSKLGGDPSSIYHNKTINEILAMKKRLWKLPGFGPKILSLLAIFYAELEMIDIPPDAFPVDVHVQRFALSTGIVWIKDIERNDVLERVLRPLLSEICRVRGWAVVEVAHAIWFLGNKLCTVCYKGSQSESYCPVYQHCGGAFTSRNYFKKGLWDPRSRYPKGGIRQFGWTETKDSLLFPQPDLLSLLR